MSNSTLVDYTRISPNRTSPRNHKIDTITIHCVVGQCSVETLGNIFAPTSRQASSNYGVGVDGRIGMYVEEKDRSWCSSNAANDNRAITIEVASDTTHPYAVNAKAYAALLDLVTDICRRNGIKKLVWSTNKNERVNHLNGCNMTVHRDYANKSCPGDYLYERHGAIAAEVVQNIRQSRRRPTKMGDMGMFSGLVFCADCGGKMYQCRATNFTEKQKHFICSTYRKDRNLCTTHTIRNYILEEIVLRNLREAISFVHEHEDDFIREASDISMRERNKELSTKKSTIEQAEKRIKELDFIFQHLYEDNITGKLSDERFAKLSRVYEDEQDELKEMIGVLKKDVQKQEKEQINIKSFIGIAKKYTDIQELDATILREFISKIYVSAYDRKSKTREIQIVYNFIGAFDFDRAKLNTKNKSNNTSNLGNEVDIKAESGAA